MLTEIKSIIAIMRHDKRGVTAMEYGLIAALIAVVIIGSLQLLGGNLSSLFTRLANRLNGIG